jgi:hypothetical protein
MSAFLVSEAHIDVLIDAAKQFAGRGSDRLRWYWGNQWRELVPGENETAVGRMLLAENARSVGHRYREAQSPAALTYTYRRSGRLDYTIAEANKTVACYNYQTCEPDDYEKTEAFAFVQALKDALLRSVGMPDATPWGWEEADLNRSAQVSLLDMMRGQA